jgi:hypothetical protein
MDAENAARIDVDSEFWTNINLKIKNVSAVIL